MAHGAGRRFFFGGGRFGDGTAEFLGLVLGEPPCGTNGPDIGRAQGSGFSTQDTTGTPLGYHKNTVTAHHQNTTSAGK